MRSGPSADCGHPESDTTSGLVAYLDGKPAGWCAVESRTAYRRLPSTRVPWAGRGPGCGLWSASYTHTISGQIERERITVRHWLLDSDASIRWQVMRDLTDEPTKAAAAERTRVAREGWGARLLLLQADDGQWGGGAYSPKWTSTTYTLLLLRHLGLDPTSSQSRHAVDKVRQNVVMGRAQWPFFEYRGETCITGMCLALAAYFRVAGEASDRVVDWILDEQLTDGGWNCDTMNGSVRASFNTTISVLEGLLEYERAGGNNGSVAEARSRAHEYLLERRMFRSLRSGEVVNPRWKLFSVPAPMSLRRPAGPRLLPVLVLGDHPLQATDLTLDPGQPPEIVVLVDLVSAHIRPIP